ncbi:unnamed protein product [Vitrella brassicaformis CCMP3155]|uniref:Uncharacterized protein n=1 Tax=Vitrella brassicaformis (strain CCMP3155) TaxID=1169540 RepID=A0A0G4FJT3_VITBC|nr:unnamed protein product [Vitrella brassicaformis CCMP3155]|eukprot:CEM14021.1 unnamed protein product [Vitrella brassicaformis CCMP3155]
MASISSRAGEADRGCEEAESMTHRDRIQKLIENISADNGASHGTLLLCHFNKRLGLVQAVDAEELLRLREERDEWRRRSEQAEERLRRFEAFEGQGKVSYSDGRRYEGQLKGGKRDGEGRMTYSDGGVYEGQWEDDERAGVGRWTCSDGVYDGQWKLTNVKEM